MLRKALATHRRAAQGPRRLAQLGHRLQIQAALKEARDAVPSATVPPS